jgi:low temperature requirement protein LtrA
MTSSLWKRPRLRADEEEREVSWLELFYDLVFVILIFVLAHLLEGQVSWEGVFAFGLLFVPVWWVWMVPTLYNDRFGTDDLSHRLFTFLLMVPIVGLAIAVPEGLGALSTAFALSYIAARAILLLMWVRAGWHDPAARPLTTRLAIGFSISLLPWVISVFVPAPARFILWTIGLSIELLTPLITIVRIQTRVPVFSTAYLSERYALFTVIVLGEIVISVVRGAAESDHPRIATGIACALGLALAFSLGWVYFDNVRNRLVKPGLLWATLRGYLHLPLLMGLTALGAGVAKVIVHEEGLPTAPTRWLICGALAFALITIGVIELTGARDRSTDKSFRWSIVVRFAAGAIALLLGLAGRLDLFVLLSLLVLLCVGQMMLSLSLRFTAPGRDTG